MSMRLYAQYLTPTQDSGASEEISCLKEQNSVLRAVVSQMRKDMEAFLPQSQASSPQTGQFYQCITTIQWQYSINTAQFYTVFLYPVFFLWKWLIKDGLDNGLIMISNIYFCQICEKNNVTKKFKNLQLMWTVWSMAKYERSVNDQLILFYSGGIWILQKHSGYTVDTCIKSI